jgi:branched-chain amino acid aminotransferase
MGFVRYANLYDTGAHGVVVRTRSFNPDALDPKVKNFSRMNFNLAELEASDVDPEGWPILLDSRGNLTEGVGYNLFLVTDGVIKFMTVRVDEEPLPSVEGRVRVPILPPA